jgi:AcrR family transcriptional regulator
VPKRVDHRARRIRIADALMRVAATQGLEAVSLRHVAAEAGVSAGMVQHYFRTKDEMVEFALQAVREKVEVRLAEDSALATATTPKAMVRAILVQLLPIDDARWLEGHVGLAFHAYAAVRPALAEQLRTDAAQLRAFVADQIRAERGPEADAEDAALVLLALVEGISMQVLNRYYDAAAALDALDAQLDVTFDPARRPTD